MWDIKTTSILLALEKYAWYYLNHVGYKAISGESLLILNFCIIWTMWDIKLYFFASIASCLRSSYYLNHVGYKAELTASGLFVEVSYYLNHVGYKVFRISCLKQYIRTYYLNHVGYKGWASLWELRLWLRIIWTMWDIKRSIKDMLPLWFWCIIWTMWDIKLAREGEGGEKC